jgi:hypothetical protein
MRLSAWTPILAIAVCLLGSAPSRATSGQSNVTGAPLDAIWRIQEFDLHIRTAQRYHSCTSLREKISGILTAVGATSVVVQMSCGRDQLTNETFAKVATATPVDATQENIMAATTFDARQALIARLREQRLPTAVDLERFSAEWRTVSLHRVPDLHLSNGDCELLQGLNEQVFPRLAIRVVRKRLQCDSQALFSPSRPVLVVEALMRREV